MHSRIDMRTGSTPCRWPAWRGRPRPLAQRPLPSMMIAMWRGSVMGAARSGAGSRASDLQDLLFLGGQQLVDLGHRLVRQFLDLVMATALVVLADELFLQRLLHLRDRVAAHVAHAHPCVLGIGT